MADIPLSAPVIGIDNVSPEYSLPIGAVRDAVNVDIASDGSWERRRGTTLASAGGCHSLWTSPSGRSFGVRNGSVCSLSISGTAVTFTPIFALDLDAPVSYDEMNSSVVACNRGGLWEILEGGTARRLSLPRPPAPALTANAFGGLHAGRYAVAVSLLRGDEEGALSPSSFVDVAANGGVTVSLPIGLPSDVTDVRIYRTGPNGDVLMRAQDVPAGLTVFALGTQDLGRAADHQFLEPMPGGDFVSQWRGRLLVANGKTMRVSQPLRYGLTDPRTDWVQFPKRIDVMVGVEGGVYVGTSDGAIFLDGATPSEWKQVQKSARRVVRGSSLRVRADLLGGDSPGDRWVAVWLAENGFVMGGPDGQLVEQQAKRIRLPSSETAAGVAAAVVHDRQIIASIN